MKWWLPTRANSLIGGKKEKHEANIFPLQTFSCQVAFVPAAAVPVPQPRREVRARGAWGLGSGDPHGGLGMPISTAN